MAIKIKEWAIFGAIAGAIFPLILKLVNLVPGVSVQSTVTANIPVTGINTGGTAFLLNVLGSGSIGLPEIISAAIGGAIALVIGAWIADKFDLLKGSDLIRISTATLIGGIIVSFILDKAINVPGVEEFLILVIGSVITGVLLLTTLNLAGQKDIIP